MPPHLLVIRVRAQAWLSSTVSARQHHGHTRIGSARFDRSARHTATHTHEQARPAQRSELGRPRMIQRNHRETETPGKPCLVFLGFWSLCLLVTLGVWWWRCVSHFGRGHTRTRGCITCVVPGLCRWHTAGAYYSVDSVYDFRVESGGPRCGGQPAREVCV